MINKDKGNIHFIGVGGISMSALAEILLDKGYHVSGSDRGYSPIITALEEKGLIFCGPQKADNISDDTVLAVYTVAVKENNPELMAARSKGITVIPRSRLLGDIMSEYRYPIAVSGTHGKTTTTSMLAYIFKHADLDPTIIVGGELDLLDKKTLCLGKGDYLLAEACEYYRSFLDFKPYCATILNIEPDHLDYYKDKEDFQSAFVAFSDNILDGGWLIACADDEDMHKIIEHTKAKVITYAIKNPADVTARDISFDNGYPVFTLVIHGKKIGTVRLSVTGQHNVLNALAALANAYVLQLDMDKAIESLSLFKGAIRRFEYKFELNGAKVYDDYAHHPTEVAATVQAASKLPHGKLFCVFQPHTYSRAKKFLNKFATAFDGVDEVIIADIYAAREPLDPAIPTSLIAEKICENGVHATAISGNSTISQYLRANVQKGDLVVIMGAGDIFKIYDILR
ncbi:MAG: UDP-N-acetylmuramate--L-alanine ligase [Bacillota bacterium]|nr:UDP-N-acetylmuramate--L-alanine ligase [Bacillota bacterium]